MRKMLLIPALLTLAALLAACSSPTDPGITPAPDRLTFLFFYTDG